MVILPSLFFLVTFRSQLLGVLLLLLAVPSLLLLIIILPLLPFIKGTNRLLVQLIYLGLISARWNHTLHFSMLDFNVALGGASFPLVSPTFPLAVIVAMFPVVSLRPAPCSGPCAV